MLLDLIQLGLLVLLLYALGPQLKQRLRVIRVNRRNRKAGQ